MQLIQAFSCYFTYPTTYLFAYGIAACLPGIAVTVRRLRDAGSIGRIFLLHLSHL